MNRIKNIIDIQLETIHYLESNKNNPFKNYYSIIRK